MNAAPAQPPRIAVIGGGISGLALGHRLLGRADVTVFEASPCAGGHARTVREAGFLVETGPNGFLDRHAGVVDLAGELGLSGELIESQARRQHLCRVARRRRHLRRP